MKHIMHTVKIIVPTGEIIERLVVHYEGCISDSALCGQDLNGDDCHGDSWDLGVQTNKRVNCEHCLAVRDHVLGKNN